MTSPTSASRGDAASRGRPPSCDPLDSKLVDYPLVGRLGAAFDRLVRTVARHRVHPVLFDDLMSHPTQTWRALAAFVGIDPDAETIVRGA